MEQTERRFGLFERIGIELEYMIVDHDTAVVRPIADRLLLDDRGRPTSEVEHGDIAWSNELVQHVLEFKTNGPVPDLRGLCDRFQDNVGLANRRLAPFGAALMPGGMHPTMVPERETVLWPYEYGPVYETFDRIFQCSGHGWANLQSVHVNLPFRDDDEFERLHAAIRALLPIIPAIAASSPVMEGRVQPWLDTRLEVYRHNARRVPSVSGLLVPEPIRTEDEYHDVILRRIYRDLAPLDTDGVLRHEWVNARGAIARFDRGTIEIRVIDAQECPLADVGVAAAVIAGVKALADQATSTSSEQNSLPTDELAAILADTTREADRAAIKSPAYLRLLGWKGSVPCMAGQLWRQLIETYIRDTPGSERWGKALEVIMEEGCLARRILHRTGPAPDAHDLLDVSLALTGCLGRGDPLRGG